MSQFQLNKKISIGLEHALYNIKVEAGDTDAMAFEKYKMCSHLRHDFLHILVAELLGLRAELGISTPMSTRFPDVDFGHFGKLTPDIVFETVNKVVILDVSISLNPEHDLQSKTIKYTPLMESLKTLYKPTELVFVCVDSGLTNLEEELHKIQVYGFTMNEALISTFRHHHSKAQKVLAKLRPMIPSEFFHDELPGFKTVFRPVEIYKKVYTLDKHSQLDNIDKLTDKQAEDVFMALYDDPNIKDILRDGKHHVNKFIKAFNELESHEPSAYCPPKPTFHLLYAPSEKIPDCINRPDLKSDQWNIFNILRFVKTSGVDDPCLNFLSELHDQMENLLEDPVEKSLFQTGFFTGTYESDRQLKSSFLKKSDEMHVRGKEIENKISGVSIRQEQLIRCRTERPYFERSHQLSIGNISLSSKSFVDKSGVQYAKKHPEGRKYRQQSSCDPSHSKSFDDFYTMLSTEHCKRIKLDPMWDLPLGVDSDAAVFLKQQIRNDFKLFYKKISRTHAHHMSFHTSLAADQLIHYNNLNTKSQSFLFINTGLPNVLHVVQGGTLNRARDVGQPFFSVAITTDERWCNSVYGQVSSIRLPGKPKRFIVFTNWRRLQTHKLTLLRDQFYSAQSTGYDTFARNPRVGHKCSVNEYLKFIYVFKAIVGQATSQRVAEFLMDVRYITMACFSDFTNVSELISDKFSPHYPNAFSRWIITQLKDKVIEITNAYQSQGSKKILTPIFKGTERVQDSLGGSIDLPAIWSNYRLNDIQDLYDDLFVYVLTGKEPSSNFHEGIKSLNTILKFQSEYDQLSSDCQIGIHTVETFKEFLLSKKAVGCMYSMCEYSARCASSSVVSAKLVSDLAKATTCEVLSEIVSTKSCIPEYELEVSQPRDLSAKQEDQKQRLKKDLQDRGVDILGEHMYVPKKMVGIHPQSVIGSETYTNRAKVHDLCLDFITRFPESSQHTLDVANWNIERNNNRVEAHICIKAQYGAKREFYVVNFGAKAMVRIYENMFKAIAKQMPQEMISVPGDKKMQSMYQNVNEVLRSGRSSGDSTMFVNGDCTKWSACETMASFWGLLNGFDTILSPEQVAFSKCVLAGWANKLIEIPKDVQAGTKFITPQTEYMKTGDYIRSTQNFLQGMFNYSSSVKAVCATELAISMWDRRYGKTRPIFVRHLEHSDDYSLVIRVKNIQDFIDFRIMHRLSQKLHGINDSTKKTNSQQFIMEFISLMSFNGRMSYPNIKKTKEVGINIGGTGYQQDIMNTISRSAEALRLGVPQESCYVIQMLQGINIYRKYSLGTRNRSIISENPYNYPLDIFGLPDCLPVFYLNSVSDPNNYRLLKYSPRSLTLLKGLYVLTETMTGTEDNTFGMEMIPTFFRPQYRYYRTSKKLKAIKGRLAVTFDDLQEYRNKYPEYSICKPRETMNFKKWLMCMYYNNSFSAAYTQASRQAIMLRLSHFASGECIQDPLGTDLLTLHFFIPYYLNLLEAKSKLFNKSDLQNLERISLGSDPVLKGVFSLMHKAAISTSTFDPSPPVIMQLPNSYKFLKLENDLYSAIQYVVNKENFWKDRRFHYGLDSLERDKTKLQTLLGENPLTSSNILLLSKLLKAQRQKHTVGICFGNPSNNPIELCISTIEQGTFYGTRYRLISQKDFKVINPLTRDILYSRSFDKVYNRHSLILEELSILLHLLIYRFGITQEEALEIIKDVKDKESGFQISNVIESMSFDLTTPSDIFHKRMYVFMTSYVCQNNGPLYELVGSAYSVQHTYLNKIDILNLKKFDIFADDGVMFIFRGTLYLAIREGKDNLLLICQTTTITQASFSYLIACRLFNMLTQKKFEKMIQFNLHNCMPLVPVENLTSMCKQPKPLYFQRINQTVMTAHNPEKAFPIMMKCEIPRFTCGKHLSIPNNPEVDVDTLTVYSGKLKLFSLPFWACGDHSTLLYPNRVIKGFDLNILNTEGLLYNYMHSKNIEFVPNQSQISQLWQYFDTFKYDMSIHGFPKLGIDIVDNLQPTHSLRQELSRNELLSMTIPGFETIKVIDEQVSVPELAPQMHGISLDFSLFKPLEDPEDNELMLDDEIMHMEKQPPGPMQNLDFNMFSIIPIQGSGDDTDDDLLLDDYDYSGPPINNEHEIIQLGNHSQELSQASLSSLNVEFPVFDFSDSSESDEVPDTNFTFNYNSFQLPIVENKLDPLDMSFTWTDDSKHEIERLRDESAFTPSLEFEEADYSSDELLSDTSSEENAEFLQYMRSYIQLSDRKLSSFEGGFTRNHIGNLPDFELYLMRCWTGYEEGYWANTPSMQFQIIWLTYEVQKRNLKLPKVMDLIIKYAYREILTYLGKGMCDNVVLLRGGNAEFIGYKLIMKDVFSFFNIEIAEMAAEQRQVPKEAIYLDKEEMYTFTIERGLTDNLLKQQSIKFIRTRNILNSTLYDMASLLGLLDMTGRP